MDHRPQGIPPASLSRAFTLIELMIVIAIISILAAILIPNFLHARNESLTAACEDYEKQLATAEEEYSVDNQGLYVPFASLTTPYASTIPTDPAKKGGTYSINTAFGTYGSYQISDQGGHDSTTLVNVIQDGGSTNCSSWMRGREWVLTSNRSSALLT